MKKRSIKETITNLQIATDKSMQLTKTKLDMEFNILNTLQNFIYR